MPVQTIHEFFKLKKQKADSKDKVDWEKRKRDWIDSVEALYKTVVEDFLADAIRDGLVTVSYSDKSITEENIGTYAIREMILRVGDEQIVFSPKGRNIVGGIGRVDVRGRTGEKTLVAQPGRWTVLISRTPVLKTAPLDSAFLLEALKEIMEP